MIVFAGDASSVVGMEQCQQDSMIVSSEIWICCVLAMVVVHPPVAEDFLAQHSQVSALFFDVPLPEHHSQLVLESEYIPLPYLLILV